MTAAFEPGLFSQRESGVEAVDGASFELKPGEIACLPGPPGCGKTTLLRIAAGVERPQGFSFAVPTAGIEGDDVRYSLMFAGLDDPVIARIPARMAPQKGTIAFFEVDPQHVLIFPRDGNDTI